MRLLQLLFTILVSGSRGALGVLVIVKAISYLSEGYANGATLAIIVTMFAYGSGAIGMSADRTKAFVWLLFFSSIALISLWVIFEDARLEADRLLIVGAAGFGILISGLALLVWDGVQARRKARDAAIAAEEF